MSGTRLLLCMVLVVAGVVLAGCHSSPPPEVFGDAVLNAAVNAPFSTRPDGSHVTSGCSQGLVLLMTEPPRTREDVGAALADWTASAAAHPNDAACQLGLSLTMVARAVDNMALDLGYDLFEAAGLDSASPLALMALAASDGPGGLRAPHAQALQAATRGVGTAQLGLLVSMNMETQAAMRAHLLPALYTAPGSVYNRLAAFTTLKATRPLITLEDADGAVATIYPADFQVMCAGLAGLYGFLAESCAYNTDAGAWPPVPTIGELDANADDTLTPAEYLPPAPYGTLNPDGATQMGNAYRAYQAGIGHARSGLTAIPDDPLDLLRMLYDTDPALLLEVNAAQIAPPGTGLDDLLLILDHLDALLSGPQELTIEYWTEGGAPEQIGFAVDITRIYLAPVADVRSMLPSVPLVDAQLAKATENNPIEVMLGLFPDPTFNGVFPNLEQTLRVLETADYVRLVHGGRDWGTRDLAPLHEFADMLWMGLGGEEEFGFPKELTWEDFATLPELLLFTFLGAVAV